MYDTISVNGKDYPIKFSARVNINWENKTGKLKRELVNATTEEEIWWIYYALEEGSRLAKQKFTLKYDELVDLFDDMFPVIESYLIEGKKK